MENKNGMKIKKRYFLFAIALIIGIPVFLQFVIFGNSFPSNTSNDGWAGFFGSYLGGILGGCATLIGVVYTIKKTHEESEALRKKELQNLQRQSALVIYYDLGFAFANIKEYLSLFTEEVFEEIDQYNKNRRISGLTLLDFYVRKDRLTQLHIQSDWMKTVSRLSEAEVDERSTIDAKDIRDLYRIYGNLTTIINWTNNNESGTGEKAIVTMRQMQISKELDLNERELYSKIRKIAFGSDPGCIVF